MAIAFAIFLIILVMSVLATAFTMPGYQEENSSEHNFWTVVIVLDLIYAMILLGIAISNK